jgi:predicted deacylase
VKARPVPYTTPLVEIEPPDLSPYRAGNTGIDYVWSFAGAAPGPHVILTALTHGNEICGAIALDRMLRTGLRPARGKLTFAFANIAAYQAFNRRDPTASRYLDEDLNRVWSSEMLDGPRQSRELQRARTLRPVIDTADFLLDIHSMTVDTGPLMLTGMAEKHLAFARRVSVPAILVRDEGHAAGPRLREYGRFSDPHAPPIALLVECGQHWVRDSVDVAVETAWRFLAASGILAERDAASWLARPAPRQRTVLVTDRVTIATDEFRLDDRFNGLDVVPRAGTVIARDGLKEIRTPYDNCVLIMPMRRSIRGLTAVRLGRFED